MKATHALNLLCLTRQINFCRLLTEISLISLLIVASLGDTAQAIVYGLKSAADCCDSTAPTYLFKFDEKGGGVSGVRQVKVGTASVDADGLAVSPSLGLYAFQLVSVSGVISSRLLKLNESTGAAAPIGSLFSNRRIRGALFDRDNRLLAIDEAQNQLIEINPLTGALIGSPITLTRDGATFNVGTTSDIAQRADGTFFLIQSRSVFTLNIVTGALTLQFTDNIASGGTPYISISVATFSANAASPNDLFIYDINGSDDIFRYDVTVGASSRRLVYSNVVSSFNAGRGDLAAVVFPAAGNKPPTADAGPDKETPIGNPVSLDGSKSSDPESNYPLSYSWTLVSAPEGSSAALANANTATPSFTPDVRGIYTFELIVTDSLGLQSSPDEVLVSTSNVPPVADAGPDQFVPQLGSLVQLDGTRSFDQDGDQLTFRWSIFTAPEGSLAALSDTSSPTPTFKPDVSGEYVMSLVVTDTAGAESPEDFVTILVNFPPVANAGRAPG